MLTSLDDVLDCGDKGEVALAVDPQLRTDGWMDAMVNKGGEKRRERGREGGRGREREKQRRSARMGDTRDKTKEKKKTMR